MAAKLAFLALAFALTTGSAAAQPDPKKPDDKKLITRVYNLKPLIGEGAKANGLAVPDADAVIKLIFESLPQFHELKPDGRQIVERDGTKLEIRATAKDHGEVKDLLEAIERLQDLAIDVRADVIELDAAVYEKLLKVLPKEGRGRAGSPLLFATGEEIEEKEGAAINKALEEVSKILRGGRTVQTSSGRFGNGAEATLSARQSVVTFHNQVVNDKPKDAPQFVKEGFRLVGLPVVSADRRFIRLKLTEQSLVLTRIRKVELGEVVKDQKLVLQSAETEDVGGTGSANIADGGTALFRLAYGPKDKVWVVVLHPRIYIKAEEEEIQRQRLQKWFDFFLGR
jgi:hypothetical protein